jgi:hypothetical protein
MRCAHLPSPALDCQYARAPTPNSSLPLAYPHTRTPAACLPATRRSLATRPPPAHAPSRPQRAARLPARTCTPTAPRPTRAIAPPAAHASPQHAPPDARLATRARFRVPVYGCAGRGGGGRMKISVAWSCCNIRCRDNVVLSFLSLSLFYSKRFDS